jgi:phosphoglycerate dehydrogenase-like enzyme
MQARVAILPVDETSGAGLAQSDALARRTRIAEAIQASGGQVVELQEANAVVWLMVTDSAPLVDALQTYPSVEWVQLPWAGVETFVDEGLFQSDVRFTSAKGAFGPMVAENVVMHVLVALRNGVTQARTPRWCPLEPVALAGKRVTILGAGGIAVHVAKLLKQFDCKVTVVRRTDAVLANADITVTTDALDRVLPSTDVLVVALPLTPDTAGMIAERELNLMPRGSVLVNVARGAHVVTSDLVEALRSGQIGAAGLDVTDPEPLPDDHELWSMNNVFVTSHRANSAEEATSCLVERIKVNVTRFQDGRPLDGEVDRVSGY